MANVSLHLVTHAQNTFICASPTDVVEVDCSSGDVTASTTKLQEFHQKLFHTKNGCTQREKKEKSNQTRSKLRKSR